MTCADCHTDNPDGARFCIECGTALGAEEITARFQREELIPFELPRLEFVPVVTIGAKTDLGRVRENNEDKYDFYEPEELAAVAARGSSYIVCDGMGGHAAGQIASELACKTFLSTYYDAITSPSSAAAPRAVEQANQFIYEVGQAVPSRQGMGTTFTGLILCQRTSIVVHVGDSRCYRLRGDKLEQLSQDHTVVGEHVRRGTMTEEEAMASPYAHLVTRACGIQPEVEVDVMEAPAEIDDTYLLCSDGLTNHVRDWQLAEVLSSSAPSPAALRLLQMALDDGGSDNCTVLIVRVDDFRNP